MLLIAINTLADGFVAAITVMSNIVLLSNSLAGKSGKMLATIFVFWLCPHNLMIIWLLLPSFFPALAFRLVVIP
jgi:hypothetical protein